MTYDFSKLTKSQQWLLTCQGWEPGTFQRQPHPATVRKLVEHGLVVASEITWKGLRITVYDVPIPVHMAWCEYAATSDGARHA